MNKVRMISIIVIFAMTFSFANVSLAYVASASPAEPAKAAEVPSLLQFSSGGHVLGFEPGGMFAATGSHALHVDFVNANAVPPLSAASDLNGSGNPKRLANAAPPLTDITYPNLWEGVTLTYDATGIVRSTYTLEPYADPGAIHLRYNRPALVQADGSLRIEFEGGALTETAPLAWQEINDRRLPVAVTFKALSATEIGFALGAYNPAQPLFIDPTLTWNTFMGGSSNVDVGWGIAVDASGNVYVTGYSYASWGAPVNPHSGTGNSDAFAAKLNSSGVRQWHTFMGSSSFDGGFGIAVDAGGNVYVAGRSDASWGAPVNPHAGGGESFAAQLNSSGGLVWHTFMGSSNLDYGLGIAVDASGNVYVAGSSDASWGAPVNPFAGFYDAFAAQLNSSGGLVWHTFMGSSSFDEGIGIAVDAGGNVYVAGRSLDSWGTPVNPIAGSFDAFAAKLNSSGGLVWNTFMGGSSSADVGWGIAVDASGNVYVAGYSSDSWGAPVNLHAGSYDAFAAQLNSSGGLAWNTFMGSGVDDYGLGIAGDSGGNVYVAGYSGATWGAPVNPIAGSYDAFAAKLSDLPVPAMLTLDPAEDTNPVGSEHCVTGTVEDAFGNPIPNVPVQFTVTGAVNTSGSATTDANGQATFCYLGPAFPGADAINAYADSDNNNTQDAGEPSDIANKTWTLPPSTALCKITQGGKITADNGDKATFGGNAKVSNSGEPKGQEEYQDHGPAQPMNVHSINVLAVTCNTDGTLATIFGEATIDGAGSFFYRIQVQDLGEPGNGLDTYWIILSNGYDSGKHTLEGGNVQIHK